MGGQSPARHQMQGHAAQRKGTTRQQPVDDLVESVVIEGVKPDDARVFPDRLQLSVAIPRKAPPFFEVLPLFFEFLSEIVRRPHGRFRKYFVSSVGFASDGVPRKCVRGEPRRDHDDSRRMCAKRQDTGVRGGRWKRQVIPLDENVASLSTGDRGLPGGLAKQS